MGPILGSDPVGNPIPMGGEKIANAPSKSITNGSSVPEDLNGMQYLRFCAKHRILLDLQNPIIMARWDGRHNKFCNNCHQMRPAHWWTDAPAISTVRPFTHQTTPCCLLTNRHRGHASFFFQNIFFGMHRCRHVAVPAMSDSSLMVTLHSKNKGEWKAVS